MTRCRFHTGSCVHSHFTYVSYIRLRSVGCDTSDPPRPRFMSASAQLRFAPPMAMQAAATGLLTTSLVHLTPCNAMPFSHCNTNPCERTLERVRRTHGRRTASFDSCQTRHAVLPWPWCAVRHAMRARCLPDSALQLRGESGCPALSLLAGLHPISRPCCERCRTTLFH